MKEYDEPTKALFSKAANPYEASHFTSSNPYNTQATREVADTSKSGVVGNKKAGESLYNPNTPARNKVRKAIKDKFKKRNKGVL